MQMTKVRRERGGFDVHRFHLTDSEYYQLENDDTGLCVHCGDEVYYCEPDARQRECENCGHHTGYGVPELLMMDLISFEEDE